MRFARVWTIAALSMALPALGEAQSTGPERIPIPDPRIPPAVGPVREIPRFNNKKPGAPIRPPSVGLFTLDSAVVEADNVQLILAPLPRRWRYDLDGKRGYFSWRIDVLSGSGLSIVLAADTMMRSSDIRRIVESSTLRRCSIPGEWNSRKCIASMPGDTVFERIDHVQFQFRDTSIVNYFRRSRPPSLTGTTYEPEGRFRIDVIPIAYHDTTRNGRAKR